MKHAFLVVNGILTDPSDINGWCDVFEDYYQNEGYACTKYEYFSGAITRFLKQGKRVQQLEEIINRMKAPLIYVGHSNGCELFSRLMRDTKCTFEAAHLFAPAMEADCNLNGITLALLSNRLKNVYLYCSHRDLVLRDWASKTSILRFMGIGYGTLGYSGPVNVLPQIEHRVYVHWNNRFGHSDWFTKKNIKDSFALTLRK